MWGALAPCRSQSQPGRPRAWHAGLHPPTDRRHPLPPQAAAQAVWEGHLAQVIATNSDPSATWTAAMNQYCDLSWEEFSAAYLGATPPKAAPPVAAKAKAARKLLQTSPPATMDWVALGKVTPIRSQGSVSGAAAVTAH